MIKTFSAIAIASLVAAALTVLPGFAPQVEASTPVALAKADRLDIRTAGRDCSQQSWPNFEASCLRVAGNNSMIREARLVTADRTPQDVQRHRPASNKIRSIFQRSVADYPPISPARKYRAGAIVWGALP